jgi:SAM-dependent methyltransferase
MLLTRGCALLILGGALLAAPATRAQDPGPHEHDDRATSEHRFSQAEDWARRFEDPSRDSWQLPDQLLEVLVERPDMVVADIGSATGYFPVRFARACPEGLVIGADVEPDMVFYLNDRARREGLSNLVSVLAAYDDPHLPVPADLIFICNTYHHIDGRRDYFQRLQAQLAPGGRVVVVDFRPESSLGPAHKLAAEQVVEEMTTAGYVLDGRHRFLPEQYVLVFRVAEPR